MLSKIRFYSETEKYLQVNSQSIGKRRMKSYADDETGEYVALFQSYRRRRLDNTIDRSPTIRRRGLDVGGTRSRP